MSIQDKVNHVLNSGQSRNHICHWPGCNKQVPPAMWGCKSHWFRLPSNIRGKIWSAYSIGQEVNGTPSKEYIDAANAAQEWIAVFERRTP